MAETPKHKGKIIASSMEGGGVLDLIQIVKLAYDELLTGGRPAGTLYQAFAARSGGAIPTVALIAPDPDNPGKPLLTAREVVPIFVNESQKFFKPIHLRMPKMLVSQFFNLLEKKFIDPDRKNATAAKKTQELCAELKEKISDPHLKLVGDIEKTAGSRWLTTRNKDRMIDLSRRIGSEEGAVKPLTDAIETLLVQRETRNRFNTWLLKRAMNVMDAVRERWAHSFMFDSEVPKKTYHELLGGRRLSDCLRATYVYAYNLTHQSAELFMCRPSDFLSDDPATPRTVSRGNDLLQDVIMGTTAHPFGYQPYITADSEKVLTDKGNLQPALSFVMDLWYHAPDDVPIKLTLHNTGDYLDSSDRKENWKLLSPEQKRERAKTIQREYVEDGVLGNVIKGVEMSEQGRYVETVTNLPLRLLLEKRNGGEKNNITDISPRLVARTPDEIGQMPSRNVLDASPENLLKIFNAAFRMLREKQDVILDEHAMLIENLHDLGQMNDADFQRFMDINRTEKKRGELSRAFKAAYDRGTMNDVEYRAAARSLSAPDNPYSLENFERSWDGLVGGLRDRIKPKNPLNLLNLSNPF